MLLFYSEYCRSIKRNFEIVYDPYTQKLEVLDTATKVITHILHLSVGIINFLISRRTI